jgi:nucleoside-diphosphate-sugar epimerase
VGTNRSAGHQAIADIRAKAKELRESFGAEGRALEWAGTPLPPSPFSKPHSDPGALPMQVFLTGATGYIGFAVATALRRHGHRVWGLARNETKAARLARHEIDPVIGDLADPKSYADVAARCSVLIHTAFDYSDGGVAKNKLTIDTLLDGGRRGAQPKTLIFTSGAWVYGDTGDQMVDETTPLNPI